MKMYRPEPTSKEAKLLRLILAHGAKGFKSPIETVEFEPNPSMGVINGRLSSQGRLFYFLLERNEKDKSWGRAWSAQPIESKNAKKEKIEDEDIENDDNRTI